MVKGPSLYTDIDKKARDLLYKDYHSVKKLTINTYSPTGVAITSSGTKKSKFFLANVNTQLKNKNITTDIKVDTNSNLFTTITVNEPAPGVKAILSFKVPEQTSGKVELQYLHEYAGISRSVGLKANPIVNFLVLLELMLLLLVLIFLLITKLGELTKFNAAMNFVKDDLVGSLTLNEKVTVD
ncbi:unnamed protein product [Lathyrus sativus]|nr:unnamed protein product [Lathyrus sativus]